MPSDDLLTREEVEAIQRYLDTRAGGGSLSVTYVSALVRDRAALRELLAEAKEVVEEVVTLHQQVEPLGVAIDRARDLASRLEELE